MPIYEYQCAHGHKTEAFSHVAADRGCETHICHCGSTMGPVVSFGKALVYFGEGEAKEIWNLARPGENKPFICTSHKAHKERCKELGVEPDFGRRGGQLG